MVALQLVQPSGSQTKIQGYTVKIPYIPYICAEKPGKNSYRNNYETSSQTYTLHPVRGMHRLRGSD
ncbi:MAG: hypothetical protein EGQ20_03150, partial [Bacteroides oleiciplenus]|nr:hypothetical protein [Bacteroides oleiciplenus]